MPSSHASDGSTPAFRVIDLVKRYPGKTKPAIDGVTLQVERGEVFGILGGNGAGKTTLVRQMLSLAHPTSGRVELFGEDVHANAFCVQRQVGYQAQQGEPLKNLPIDRALTMTTRLRGFSKPESKAEAKRLVELWGLREFSGRPMFRLSGGQQRICRLALAMAGRPPVLVLDEPTSGLDPEHRRRTWKILSAANTLEAVTVVLITHDAIEAERVVERVALVKDGRVAAVGRTGELRSVVGDKLRLEISFPAHVKAVLPLGPKWREMGPSRFAALLETATASEVLSRIELAELEDVRLHSTTLEDLYFHYAKD
jgi:ABC-type multidrug transport system ATPase subunit